MLTKLKGCLHPHPNPLLPIHYFKENLNTKDFFTGSFDAILYIAIYFKAR